MKRIATKDETARYLKIGRSSLDKWRMKNDGPPFIKYGRRVVYDLDLVDTWFENRVRKSTRSEDTQS